MPNHLGLQQHRQVTVAQFPSLQIHHHTTAIHTHLYHPHSTNTCCKLHINSNWQLCFGGQGKQPATGPRVYTTSTGHSGITGSHEDGDEQLITMTGLHVYTTSVKKPFSNLMFYTQSTSMVISGQWAASDRPTCLHHIKKSNHSHVTDRFADGPSSIR